MNKYNTETLSKFIDSYANGDNLEKIGETFGFKRSIVLSCFHALQRLEVIGENEKKERSSKIERKKRERKISKPKKKEKKNKEQKQFPYNLYLAIFGEEMPQLENEKDGYSGLMYLLNNELTKRENDVIRSIFIDMKTMKEMSEEYMCSAQNVSLIKNRALQKLQARKMYISEGLLKYTEHLESLKTPKKLVNEERARIEELRIDYLNFSARAFHVLSRAGIENLGDIKSVEQLRRLRNCGEKTLTEIINKLNEYGISLEDTGWQDEEDSNAF